MGKGHKAKLFRKRLSTLPHYLYPNWKKFLTNWSLICCCTSGALLSVAAMIRTAIYKYVDDFFGNIEEYFCYSCGTLIVYANEVAVGPLVYSKEMTNVQKGAVHAQKTTMN